MALSYLLGRLMMPRYTIPVALLVGVSITAATGQFGSAGALDLSLSTPVFVMPSFNWAVLLGIGLPLYVVTMCSQNIPGVVTLRAAGYAPPVSFALIVTGLASVLLAPFGGYAFNLAAITAAICAGPEADEDPRTRYLAAVIAGLIYCLVGLGGAAVIGVFLLAPPALVAAIAGLALLGTIATSLSRALAVADTRESGLVTFMIALSGVGFGGIGAPFWALIIGYAVYHILAQKTD